MPFQTESTRTDARARKRTREVPSNGRCRWITAATAPPRGVRCGFLDLQPGRSEDCLEAGSVQTARAKRPPHERNEQMRNLKLLALALTAMTALTAFSASSAAALTPKLPWRWRWQHHRHPVQPDRLHRCRRAQHHMLHGDFQRQHGIVFNHTHSRPRKFDPSPLRSLPVLKVPADNYDECARFPCFTSGATKSPPIYTGAPLSMVLPAFSRRQVHVYPERQALPTERSTKTPFCRYTVKAPGPNSATSDFENEPVLPLTRLRELPAVRHLLTRTAGTIPKLRCGQRFMSATSSSPLWHRSSGSPVRRDHLRGLTQEERSAVAWTRPGAVHAKTVTTTRAKVIPCGCSPRSSPSPPLAAPGWPRRRQPSRSKAATEAARQVPVYSEVRTATSSTPASRSAGATAASASAHEAKAYLRWTEPSHFLLNEGRSEFEGPFVAPDRVEGRRSSPKTRCRLPAPEIPYVAPAAHGAALRQTPPAPSTAARADRRRGADADDAAGGARQTIVSTALPTIVGDIGTSTTSPRSSPPTCWRSRS